MRLVAEELRTGGIEQLLAGGRRRSGRGRQVAGDLGFFLCTWARTTYLAYLRVVGAH